MLETLNAVLSLLLSAFAGWAIMSRCVKDGVIIKVGLVLLSLGSLAEFFLTLDPGGLRALTAAHVTVSLGLLICVAGYLLRTRHHKRRIRARRLSDWVDAS